MIKVALLDVDMTLVDNHTSEYNQALIDFLFEQQIEKVYLVTGRNPNDMWQHVLNMGDLPKNWRNQLLYNIAEHLELNGLQVMGISTPYDHYLNLTKSTVFKINQAGDAASLFYIPFEKKIAHLEDKDINSSVLMNNFSNITGGKQYVEYPQEAANAQLIDALPMYLALIDDTEKRGQLSYLLKRIAKDNPDELDIVYFDDKSENLATAKSIFSTYSGIASAQTILVDKVHGYEAPERENERTGLKFG